MSAYGNYDPAHWFLEGVEDVIPQAGYQMCLIKRGNGDVAMEEQPDVITAFLTVDLNDYAAFREHVWRLDQGDAEIPCLAFRVDKRNSFSGDEVGYERRIVSQLLTALQNFSPIVKGWLGCREVINGN